MSILHEATPPLWAGLRGAILKWVEAPQRAQGLTGVLKLKRVAVQLNTNPTRRPVRPAARPARAYPTSVLLLSRGRKSAIPGQTPRTKGSEGHALGGPIASGLRHAHSRSPYIQFIFGRMGHSRRSLARLIAQTTLGRTFLVHRS